MLSTLLTLVGLATLGNLLFRLYKFGNHFLRASDLPRYLHGEAWALVTGASDGIGLGMAGELAKRGFNVVLHGRNESKLDLCLKRLQIKYPERKFRIHALDAKTAAPMDVVYMANKMPKNVTVLVNNVGITGDMKRYTRFLDRSVTAVGNIITVNEKFPDMLTRALLPQLIENQPALVINVGSVLDSWPAYGLEEYTGGKAHNRAFSHSLRMSMKLENYDIESMYARVTTVATPGSGEKPSLAIVTPEIFAKGVLDRVGCPEGETLGCFRHAAMVGLSEFLIPNAKTSLGNTISGMLKKDKIGKL